MTPSKTWSLVDASRLETLRGPQCPEEIELPDLHETMRCLRQAGHDGKHWGDLETRP